MQAILEPRAGLGKSHLFSIRQIQSAIGRQRSFLGIKALEGRPQSVHGPDHLAIAQTRKPQQQTLSWRIALVVD
jgi:hypothetical protein